LEPTKRYQHKIQGGTLEVVNSGEKGHPWKKRLFKIIGVKKKKSKRKQRKKKTGLDLGTKKKKV